MLPTCSGAYTGWRSCRTELGQPFIVDNKPGVAGTVGVGAVARAKPDGYTILIQSSSYTITPITYPNTSYDTLRDLGGRDAACAAAAGTGDLAGQGHRFGERADRRRPGQARRSFNYASAGVGTANQLNAERFRIGAGIDAVHVPFKGTPEALNEVLAGGASTIISVR